MPAARYTSVPVRSLGTGRGLTSKTGIDQRWPCAERIVSVAAMVPVLSAGAHSCACRGAITAAVSHLGHTHTPPYVGVARPGSPGCFGAADARDYGQAISFALIWKNK